MNDVRLPIGEFQWAWDSNPIHRPGSEEMPVALQAQWQPVQAIAQRRCPSRSCSNDAGLRRAMFIDEDAAVDIDFAQRVVEPQAGNTCAAAIVCRDMENAKWSRWNHFSFATRPSIVAMPQCRLPRLRRVPSHRAGSRLRSRVLRILAPKTL